MTDEMKRKAARTRYLKRKIAECEAAVNTLTADLSKIEDMMENCYNANCHGVALWGEVWEAIYQSQYRASEALEQYKRDYITRNWDCHDWTLWNLAAQNID